MVQTALQTHQRTTRHNTPGIMLAIEQPATKARKSPRLNPTVMQDTPAHTDAPNSNCIPFFSHHNMLSQEALDLVTQLAWDTPGEEWTLRYFLDHSPTECVTKDNFHDVNIEHLCVAMVHPKTGETIAQYKKLSQDAATEILETWQPGFGKTIEQMA